MIEFIQEYLPEVIAAITGIVSTVGVGSLLTYVVKIVKSLKSDNEITDMKKEICHLKDCMIASNSAIHELTENNKVLQAVISKVVYENDKKK